MKAITEDIMEIPEVSFGDQVETGAEDHFETTEAPVSNVPKTTHESEVMGEAHESEAIVEASKAEEVAVDVDVA
ncbi:hypothetical protein Nepgr_017085 [Nepenthes gracilis]|uniref:Uncharacterized protein n=1 Tax=Nepenthes gracilis TaxID=150966 RepID=A0AAD3SQX6_NEPGR|nr:hypothetical protein Nepgr_017085 [Nepenthes gracilis]